MGRVDGETRCSFWAGDPTSHSFDPSRLITVDLSRTPSAASQNAIAWHDVELDDPYSGPGGEVMGNTLGVRWPELQMYGVVCVARTLIARLPEQLRPPCPPEQLSGRDYEYMT